MLALALAAVLAQEVERPNVVLILADDLGAGDLKGLASIGRLAAEAVSLNRFYAAAPICSPSRAGLMTGTFPSRRRINNYLQARAGNKASGQDDWLDPAAPCLARAFKEAGYATAHFGKWHLGGGRDVQDAPLPSDYGFDEHHVNFEGMGPRFETDGVRTPGRADGREIPRTRFTEYWTDRAIDFLRRRKAGPFYLNLWPQDPHDPHLPDLPSVLAELDRNVGRLLDALRESGLEKRTIVIFTSDNGPQPSMKGERSGGLRGQKWSLYEGGIRVPCLIRGPGLPPGPRQDVVAAVDLFPTLAALAGLRTPEGLDGEDRSGVLRGASTPRAKPLFWEYGRGPNYLQPRIVNDRAPSLAVLEGNWKLLVDASGKGAELYDLGTDPREASDLASRHPDLAVRLKDAALAWRMSLP